MQSHLMPSSPYACLMLSSATGVSTDSMRSIIVTIVYGVTQDGVMGTVGLISASVALAMVTGVNLFTRDANIFVDDEAAVATCPASRPAPGPSPWPLLFAIGAFAMVLGLVTVEPMFIIGIVVMFAGGAEWTAQAWAERASSSTAHNSEVRSRIANLGKRHG